MQSKVVIILGPTCTGKTSLGLKLCQLFNGAIISADSRQVVRYMDIGTGKIPAGENNRQLKKREDRWVVDGVDIFGYDLVNPDEYFSAYDFVNYCQSIFSQIRHDATFLVGGTGFYIDAITGRASLEGIGPNIELRKSLEKLSVEELGKKLLELDESAYKGIDTKNPARLVRAIEKVVQLTTSDKVNKVAPIVEKVAYIGLSVEREILYQRADKWVDSIFNEKLFEEVKLIQTRFPKSHRLNGLIYKSTVDYLNGVTDIKETVERAKFDMHAYIRRQQTWFKRNAEIKWLDICDKNFDSGAISIVESELNG